MKTDFELTKEYKDCFRFLKSKLSAFGYPYKVLFIKFLRKVRKRCRFFLPIVKRKAYIKECNTVFENSLRFSILTPLYNTDPKMLKAMIESVLRQSYSDWELCLADGSDEEHEYVGEIVRSFPDPRIKYVKTKNKGISGNTNVCLSMATGNVIAMLDHDDLLHPSALFRIAEVMEETGADLVYTDENTFRHRPQDAYCPNYKPDYSPDLLRSYNYICHLSAFTRELLEKAGAEWDRELDGSQDYDMILRLTEKARKIEHIPEVLYFWRASRNSVASGAEVKPYCIAAAKKAIAAHLERIGLDGTVEDAAIASTYRIQYTIAGNPLISIVIPNKDHIKDLKKCIESIQEKSTWENYEIVICENNSTEAETFQYYDTLGNVKVLKYQGDFNYSKINNFAVAETKGEYLLFLNNDTEVISPDWMEQMLMFAQREDVGAVGAKLYYPDDTIQHAGVVIGIGGIAGHWNSRRPRNDPGFMGRAILTQNFSAVTGACLMVSRQKFLEAGGFDENLAVAFNDVDFCLKLREEGLLNVWTPYAELYHYESKSRGAEDTPEKYERFLRESELLKKRYQHLFEVGDPYYNRNLPLFYL